ncbi:hypothetical protein [Candidatus Rariloculus sp.]|uniref:hypothetical protein n=1 Tax=Candidatus Rariloculus sp. TaxID=3101265 RepID=UPI003D0AF4A6
MSNELLGNERLSDAQAFGPPVDCEVETIEVGSSIPTLYEAIPEPADVSPRPAAAEEIQAQSPGGTRQAGGSKEIKALERNFAELASRCSDVEQRLAANATAIDTLTRQVALAQQAVIEGNAAQQQLAGELEERDARLAALERTVTGGSTGKRNLRTEIERRDLEIDSLSGYIATRKSRWEEMEALVAADSARIAELEHELKQRVEREERAESFAREESRRATELRRKLAELKTGQRESQPGPAQETASETAPADADK